MPTPSKPTPCADLTVAALIPRHVADGETATFQLDLAWNGSAPWRFRPGQFVMLRPASWGMDP